MGTISCERWQMSERITWLLHHQPTFAFVTKGQSFKRKNEQTYRRRTYISIFLGNCIVFGATAAEGYNSVGVRFVAVWSAPLHARKKNQLDDIVEHGPSKREERTTYQWCILVFGILTWYHTFKIGKNAWHVFFLAVLAVHLNETRKILIVPLLLVYSFIDLWQNGLRLYWLAGSWL